LEKFSNHPLAHAVTSAAPDCVLPEVKEFADHPGYGVAGIINGRKWIFGNFKMLSQASISCPDIPENLRGLTLICGACDGEFAGFIDNGDIFAGDDDGEFADFHDDGDVFAEESQDEKE
jgi:Cu+-exporting ATPase